MCQADRVRQMGSPRTVALAATVAEVTAHLGDRIDIARVAEADVLARMRRLRSAEVRDAFVAVRLAATWLLRETSGAPAAVIHQRCPTCGGTDHGRPAISGAAGWRVSWSRRPGFIAAAVARNTPVGIDIESAEARLPAEVGSGHPEHDLVGWTRAEALVKVGATDLDAALASLPAGPASTDGIRWPGYDAWLLTDRTGPGWTASVASASTVVWRSFSTNDRHIANETAHTVIE